MRAISDRLGGYLFVAALLRVAFSVLILPLRAWIEGGNDTISSTGIPPTKNGKSEPLGENVKCLESKHSIAVL